MKRRKALLSEEELLVRDNVCKAKLLKHVSRLCTDKNRTKHMISMNTYHLACAEGSALQCCSFSKWLVQASKHTDACAQ